MLWRVSEFVDHRSCSIEGSTLAMKAKRPLTPDPFTELVQALRESLQPPPVMPSASACPMAKPVTYSCSGFLLQCSLYFELQPHQFGNDRANIAFIMSLLSGRALQWAEVLWNSRSPLVRSYDTFVDHFHEVFGKSLPLRSSCTTSSSDYGKRTCPYMTIQFDSVPKRPFYQRSDMV
uniref:DUF4939 domain-containing protein n=1 Tax=Sinocyclocheilus rhinocerous TaxID=307959 RepID=A0A673GIZ2_9TELE